MAKFITLSKTNGVGNGSIVVNSEEYYGRIDRTDKVNVYLESDVDNKVTCLVTQSGRGTYVSGIIKLSETQTGSAISNNYTIPKGGKTLYLTIPVTNGQNTIITLQRYKKSDNSIVSFNSSSYGSCSYKTTNNTSYKTLNISGASNLSAGVLMYTLTTTEGNNDTYQLIFKIELPKNSNSFDIYYKLNVDIDNNNQYISSPDDLTNYYDFIINQIYTSLSISPNNSKTIITGSGTSDNTTEYIGFDDTTYADVKVSNIFNTVNFRDNNKIGLKFSPSYLTQDGVVRITIPAIKDITDDTIKTSTVDIYEGDDIKTFTIKRKNSDTYRLENVYSVYADINSEWKIEFTTNCKTLVLGGGSNSGDNTLNIYEFLQYAKSCKIGNENITPEIKLDSTQQFRLYIQREEGIYADGEIIFDTTKLFINSLYMSLLLRGIGVTTSGEDFEVNLS